MFSRIRLNVSSPAQPSAMSHSGSCLGLSRVFPPGFWLLALLLGLSVRPAYGEWMVVEKPYPVQELRTVYIDPATIVREGNLVTIWQLTDFRWMQGGPRATPRFLSTKTQKQFECMEKRVRLLTYTEFSHRMATGKASGGSVDQNMWLAVEPDSINHALWEIACGRL
jgi:hypothetical protein